MKSRTKPLQLVRHQLGHQQRHAPAWQARARSCTRCGRRGADAPEQVSELRGERSNLGEPQLFVALGPGLLVGRTAAIVLLGRLDFRKPLAQPRHRLTLQPFPSRTRRRSASWIRAATVSG